MTRFPAFPLHWGCAKSGRLKEYPAVATALSSQDLDIQSASSAAKLGFSPVDLDVSKIITATIQQCLTDYCFSTPGCSDAKASRKDAEIPGTLCSTSQQQLCYNHTNICNSVYAPVIDDIAGVGVSTISIVLTLAELNLCHQIYTSYWMQNGIALVAFALLRLFDFWIYYMTIALLFCFSGFQKAKTKAEKAKQMGLRYRVPNLVSALFEFHKAQCFFMIAVQAAAIITVRGGGFQAKTLQQLSNSYSAITLVSICGYLPVVFTLVNLHGAGKSSWYIIALSSITVVISGVTAFATQHFDPSPNDLTFLRDITGGWASCGNKNPTTFCLSPPTVDPFGYAGGAKHTFVFCIIVLFLLIVDKSRKSRSASVFTDTCLKHSALRSKSPTSHIRRTLTQLSVLSRLSAVPSYFSILNSSRKRTLGNLLYGCVWIGFLFFYCRCVYLLSTWINHQSGVIGPSTWTFGQV
ncbi:MAG: hypothetical protein LQ343_001896 [Gyalolechia ehrenbergii]|nr:MAG: hypothetical protein LQ343_001896 [Gyalolechia ehrenbergii]